MIRRLILASLLLLPALSPARALDVGINVIRANYYSGANNFLNLVAGDNWRIKVPGKDWAAIPADRFSPDRTTFTLRPGETAGRSLNKPSAVLLGRDATVTVTWQGSANVSFVGPISNVSIAAGRATFSWRAAGAGNVAVRVTNPVGFRGLDARATGNATSGGKSTAAPSTVFDPQFLADVSKYKRARFVKWTNVESNNAVTWATRGVPGTANWTGSDGVPLEHIVALANAAKVDPWFNMPWNADDDYIRRAAIYVRDHLDPTLKAYVETSNEVWNYGYPVTKQAETEGLARGLSTNAFQATLRRYAERTQEVMAIWSGIYTGKMNRLVRVAATQNGSFAVTTVLSFRDTAQKVDAIAVAPYFGSALPPGRIATVGLEAFFASTVPALIDQALTSARAAKEAASPYGLRFITYEGGQHFLSPNDIAQLKLIERSPLMETAYTRYLTRWQAEFGDPLTLYADYGLIDNFGAWGAREYLGQPLAEAPKQRAVEKVLTPK